ncbi:MAG: DUF255 domain-containing protein, partial [Saprospiraceae bacterium]|nr:thioredoxin domain-containing protein [Bacteroidia bacterium]NNL90650.1 DUF255 domain-containing protein [Saprospiraceae bacterium]
MPKSKLNIILYSLLFIFAVGINEATSKDKIAFSKSLTKCLKKAQQEDKFIFVYVHTSWSIPCQQMEETTFKDSLVISEINHDYISLSMNAGRNKTFAKDYEVHI